MDAPPPQEDVGPYVVVAGLLRDLGFSAPEVLAEDREEGFLLLEDFGDDTYTRLLDRGVDEPALYALAVDTLVALQRAVSGARRPGIAGSTTWRACSPRRHCSLTGTAARLGVLREEYLALWRAVLQHAAVFPSDSGAARLPCRQFDAAAGSPRGAGMRTARFPGRVSGVRRAMTSSRFSRTPGAMFLTRCARR